MDETQWIRPRITVLSQGQMEQIHEQSLHILSTTGVRVDSPKARKLFSKNVSSKADENNVVHIPRTAIEWALSVAPSCVNIYDRLGHLAFRLGDTQTRFGVGVCTLYYQDPEAEDVVPFARQHGRIRHVACL